MGFFGMSKTGKNAQGQLQNIANGQYGQAQQDWNNSNSMFTGGQSVMPWYLQQQLAQADHGVGNPGDALATGQQFNPWVQGTVEGMQGNQQNVLDKYNALQPGVQYTKDQIAGNLDAYGGAINSNADQIYGDINDTAGRMQGQENAANQSITGDLTDRYNGLMAQNDAAYGQMRGQNAATYGDLSKINTTVSSGLQNSNEQTYGDELKNAEMLRPGGELQTAQAARSFAPLMASSQATLRRMGAGANDPQSMAAMNSVGAARARAMDDASAKGTATYVGTKNDIMSGRQAGRERLQNQWLNNESGLKQTQNANDIGLNQQGIDRTTGLSVAQGAGLRGQAQAYSDATNGIDAGRLGANTANANATMGRTADYYGQRNAAAQYGNQLDQQDLQNYTNVMNRGDQSAAAQAAMLRDQANNGLNYNLTDQAAKDRAAQNVGNYGFGMMSGAQGWGSQGNNAANSAAQGYGNIYQNEAANAGWGTKLIGSIAGSVLGGPIGGAIGSKIGGAIRGKVPGNPSGWDFPGG